ncbi:MAG: hypothetical protein JWP47_2280 [Polaromonas sp.]|nr:hypothetical protein [Polaromonas sp.]
MKSAVEGMSEPACDDRDFCQPDTGPRSDYLELFLVLLMATAASLAFSLLLPDAVASLAQDMIGWVFLSALSLMAVLVLARLLQGTPEQ